MLISYTFFIIYLFNKIDGNIYYGQYILLGSLLSVVSGLTGLSSSEGVVYFLSKRVYNKKIILKWSFLIDLFFGSILLCLILIFQNYISNFIDNIDVIIIILFGCKLVLKNIRNSATGFWQYQNKFKFIYKFNLFEISTLFVSLILLNFYAKSFSLHSLIKVEFCIALVFTLIYYFFYLKSIIRTVNISNHVKNLSKKKFIIYNSKLFLSRSIKSGNQKIDNLVIGAFLSTNEVAIYDKIKKILLPINVLVNPLREIYFTKILELLKLNKLNQIKFEIINSSKIILGLCSSFILIISILINYLFQILVIEINSENKFIFYCLVFVAFYHALFWWARIISNSFNPNISITSNLISTLIILLMSTLLINLFGFLGLGLALILNYVILAIFWSMKFKKYVYNKSS